MRVRKRLLDGKEKYGAFVLIAALLVTLAMFVGLHRISKNIVNSIEESSYDYLYGSTEMIRKSFDGAVSSDMQALRRYADHIQTDDLEATGTILNLYNSSVDRFRKLYFAREDGQVVDSNGRVWSEAELSEREAWTSYRDESGYVHSVLRVSVNREGEPGGILYAEVVLQDYYSDEIFAFQGGEGRAYLFDSEDGSWLIRSPSSELLDIKDGSVYATLAANHVGEGEIGEFRRCVEEDRTGIFRFGDGKNAVCLCTAPSGVTPDWHILTVISMEALQARANSINVLLWVIRGIFLASVALALAAFLVYSRERERARLKKIREKMEQDTRAREKRLSEITTREYDFQIILDLDSLQCRLEVYKEVPEGLNVFSGGDYAGALREFCHRFIGQDHAQEFCAFLEAERLVRDFRRNGLSDSMEYCIHDGKEEVWYECSLVFSALEGRNYAFIMNKNISRRIEDRRALHAALEAARTASEAKGRFLANMSHDLRTPLNAIVGMAKLASRDANDPDKVRQYMETVQNSSGHLLGLINDVLDMSRIENGKLVLEEEPFNFSEAVSRAADIVRPLCEAKGQDFQVETRGLKHDRLIGDMVRLDQVLVNLLNNANKFTPKGGRIRLRAWEEEQTEDGYAHFCLQVEDSGINIAPENREYIFEAFEREETSEVRHIEGTGLGLSIVRSIVRAMGGEVGLESEVGRGSVFTVSVPLKVSDVENREDGEVSLGGLKMLVAEDNLVNQEIIRSLLEYDGVQVDMADNGQEAVELFSASQPGTYAAVLMDVQMPVMDGYEACRNIRALARPDAATVPVIAITANTFAEDVKKAITAGMDGHIGKPVSLEAIRKAYGRVLAARTDEGKADGHCIQ